MVPEFIVLCRPYSLIRYQVTVNYQVLSLNLKALTNMDRSTICDHDRSPASVARAFFFLKETGTTVERQSVDAHIRTLITNR